LKEGEREEEREEEEGDRDEKREEREEKRERERRRERRRQRRKVITFISPLIYFRISFGNSVLPFTPPNADPCHTRP